MLLYFSLLCGLTKQNKKTTLKSGVFPSVLSIGDCEAWGFYIPRRRTVDQGAPLLAALMAVCPAGASSFFLIGVF